MPASCRVGEGRSGGGQVIEKQSANFGAHTGTGLEAGRFTRPGQGCPAEDNQGEKDEKRHQFGARPVFDKNAMDDAGCQGGLDDEQQAAAESQTDGQEDPQPCRSGVPQQPVKGRFGCMCGWWIHRKLFDSFYEDIIGNLQTKGIIRSERPMRHRANLSGLGCRRPGIFSTCRPDPHSA